MYLGRHSWRWWRNAKKGSGSPGKVLASIVGCVLKSVYFADFGIQILSPLWVFPPLPSVPSCMNISVAGAFMIDFTRLNRSGVVAWKYVVVSNSEWRQTFPVAGEGGYTEGHLSRTGISAHSSNSNCASRHQDVCCNHKSLHSLWPH